MSMPANGWLEKETILKKKMLLGTPANEHARQWLPGKETILKKKMLLGTPAN